MPLKNLPLHCQLVDTVKAMGIYYPHCITTTTHQMSLIENLGPKDRVLNRNLILNLTSDTFNAMTHTHQEVKVKRSDRRTDRRTYKGDCITSHANAVSKK